MTKKDWLETSCWLIVGAIIGAIIGSFILLGIKSFKQSRNVYISDSVAVDSTTVDTVSVKTEKIDSSYWNSRKKVREAIEENKNPRICAMSNKNGTVLIMGGVFGMLGYLVNHLYSGVLHLNTDTVAMTVATLGVIARFTIGKSGLTGEYTESEKRQYFSQGQELLYNIVLGLAVGIIVSYVAAYLKDLGVSKEFLVAGYPALCFGISAITLIFAQMGFDVPTTHHISLPAANAAVLSGNPIIGVVVAIACSLMGDFFTKTINSYVDTHIDPPACAIFIMESIVFGLFM